MNDIGRRRAVRIPESRRRSSARVGEKRVGETLELRFALLCFVCVLDGAKRGVRVCVCVRVCSSCSLSPCAHA